MTKRRHQGSVHTHHPTTLNTDIKLSTTINCISYFVYSLAVWWLLDFDNPFLFLGAAWQQEALIIELLKKINKIISLFTYVWLYSQHRQQAVYLHIRQCYILPGSHTVGPVSVLHSSILVDWQLLVCLTKKWKYQSEITLTKPAGHSKLMKYVSQVYSYEMIGIVSVTLTGRCLLVSHNRCDLCTQI